MSSLLDPDGWAGEKFLPTLTEGGKEASASVLRHLKAE
jgi:hypothetical protein